MTPYSIEDKIIVYFIAQALLLIPIIIIEAILLKKLLKKSLEKSLKFCAVANIVSTLAGICFIFINKVSMSIMSPFSDSTILMGLLFIFVVALIVSMLLEYKIYRYFWKNISKIKLFKALIIVNIIKYITLIILIILALYVSGSNGRASEHQDKTCRISCISNLKIIGVALMQYADDYNDFLPNKSGAEGLEQLRSNDYLTDHNIYICPTTSTLKENNQKLTEKNVDYIYQAGLQDPPGDGKDASKVPIAWDKPTNHKNYGNVLFLDGHVKGFKGANWMEQAGIREKALPIMRKYKHFNMAEENNNIILKSHSNKIIAIIHDTLLDSQSVLGNTSKTMSKSQAEWESEWSKTHEIFRSNPQKCKYIYVSTINAVSGKIIKQKIDELDKNIFEIIIVKADVDINISKMRSFIHNVGKADLKVAFLHTDISKCNDGNMLYWDGE